MLGGGDSIAGSARKGHWVYISDPEEIPVTFQIGIVGSDGILLASDRATTRINGYRGSPFMATKITTVGDFLAYCCAGDDTAITLSNEIEKNIDRADIEELDLKSTLIKVAQR